MTLRRTAAPSSTTNTVSARLSSESARLGMMSASSRMSVTRRTVANMPGLSRPWRSTSSVTRIVPVAASTTGLTRSTRPGNRSPGNASTSMNAGWPTESRVRSRSGAAIVQRSGSKSEMRNRRCPLDTVSPNFTARSMMRPEKGAVIRVKSWTMRAPSSCARAESSAERALSYTSWLTTRFSRETRARS